MPTYIAKIDGDEAFALGGAASAVREPKGHIVPNLDARRITVHTLYCDAPVVGTLVFRDSEEPLGGNGRDEDQGREVQRGDDAELTENRECASALAAKHSGQRDK